MNRWVVLGVFILIFIFLIRLAIITILGPVTLGSFIVLVTVAALVIGLAEASRYVLR